MRRLFARYVKTFKRGIRRFAYKVYLRFGVYIKNTDARYLYIFNKAVRQKGVEIGLEHSKFLVPSGASADENYSTARDMLRITAATMRYPFLQKVLGTKAKEISVMGERNRKITVENTVVESTVGGIFPILSSKTGSWGTDWYNLAVITEIEGKSVIGVIMGAETDANRYAAMKELLDICLRNETHDSYVTKALIAIAAIVKADGSYAILYEKNADKKCNPASLTKLMTAMVVLDNINNLGEIFTYKYIDMCRRTGLVIEGDKLTVEDALYDMLLPSSNQSAQALARFTGKRILKKQK